MKPFTSSAEMLNAHELMFGTAGRQCAETVLRWAGTLFAVPLDVLNIRVVLAPIEIGPYNRHAGYHYGDGDQGAFILGNRHVVELRGGDLVLTSKGFVTRYEDFVVHEMTHIRQRQLLREHHDEEGWHATRGVHRDRGWFTAVAEAAPKYLGVELPQAIWPTGPRPRPGTLTEVEMCHWPASLRGLIEANDPRLR